MDAWQIFMMTSLDDLSAFNNLRESCKYFSAVLENKVLLNQVSQNIFGLPAESQDCIADNYLIYKLLFGECKISDKRPIIHKELKEANVLVLSKKLINRSVPKNLRLMCNLRHLNLSGLDIIELPNIFDLMGELRSLILSNNKELAFLPVSIRALKELLVFEAINCAFKAVPRAVKILPKIKQIKIF